MQAVKFISISEFAIMIEFGELIELSQNKRILDLAEAIEDHPFDGFIECVPAYTTLTIYFDPLKWMHASERSMVELLTRYIVTMSPTVSTKKVVSIPVCYDEEFAIDIEEVAAYHQLSVEQVITLHTRPTYHVYFLGFSPGFPFLGGMDQQLATPRKQTPRTKIAAGSVGIAGQQTGIYPNQTPGGWQIIGRTPHPLIDLSKLPPTVLHPGDQLKFIPISKQTYHQYEQGELSWESE